MRERDLFIEALQKTDPADRIAYLDAACVGDEGLRGRVLQLLVQHEKNESFLLDAPAPLPHVPPTDTIDQPTIESPSMLIGPYKLVEQIGEGGMGTVWLAQQTEPVKRLVALKVIKAGMDSRQVVARFEAERQALALMDHPNIARVLDAGTTAAGRPFFVMDLVKGVPITRYCDEHRLTPRQRLDLFVPVCLAVQHAHQKGVIHRDLKPSNVLVALYDGKPVPKVIDFGVAKAAGQSLTEKTLVTGFGAIVGTLEYMSPEQAEVNQLDIDTRSDIYSLGVLLYELLTGSPPFTRKELERVGMLEMLRVIREQEPSKPSTKLSSSDALPTLSANRGTEPAKLTRLVRGELDWIVMKALEKDRARRYETANGFAMDVQRYLADEPVQACPPSVGYCFRKFARRNKGGLAVAALVLFFLVLLGSGVGWAVRDRAARQSRTGEQVDLILGEVDRLEREQKWLEAVAVVRRAEAVVAGGEVDAPTAERVRDRLRDLDFIDRLERARMRATWVGGRQNFAEHDREYAQAFREYGVDVDELPIEVAIDRLKARPALVIPVAVAMDEWSQYRWSAQGGQGDDAAAKRLMLIARGIDPDTLRDRVRATWRRPEAEVGDDLRRVAESIDVRAEHPATLFILCSKLVRVNQADHAVRLMRDAQRLHPDDFWLNCFLAQLLSELKDEDGAVRFYTAAVSVRPQSSVALVNLGSALNDHKKFDEAIAVHRRALEVDSGEFAAHAHHNLGNALCGQGKLDEGVAAFRKAIELDPKFAGAHSNLGIALLDQKKLDEGVAAYRKAIELDPKDAGYHCGLGAALFNPKKFDEAVAAFGKAIELDRNYAKAYFGLGIALREQKKLDEAVAGFKKAIELDPKNVHAYSELGIALREQKKLDEAIACYQKAIELDPKYAVTYSNLGAALYDQKKLDDAIAAFRKAIELDPNFANAHNNLGAAYHNRAGTYAALGQWAKAAADFQHTREVDPKNDDAWRLAANAYLAAGDAASYRRTCRELVERFGQTDDPVMAERTAKVCLLAPGAVADFGVVERLAQVAVTGTEQHGYYHFFVLAKGLTEGRAGRHAEAVKWLERFAPKADRGWDIDAIAFAALAMAQHRLSRTDEAKDALARAKAIVARTLPDRSEGRPFRAGNWHDWLHAEILFRQAEDLIGVTSAQELASLRLKRWDRELAALSDEVRAKPDNPEPLANRARLYVRSGRFELAVSDFDRLVRLAPADHGHWFHRGCLLAYLGREAEYREHCRAILEQFAKSQDKYVLDQTTKTALLLPRGVGGDVQRLAERAREAQPMDPNDRWFGLLMGMAEFRAGRPNDAIPWLEKCRAADVPARWAAAEAFLAMAHHRLGRKDEAATALARCVQLIERDLPKAGVDDLTEGTAGIENWLIAHTARREAKHVVDPNPSVQTK